MQKPNEIEAIRETFSGLSIPEIESVMLKEKQVDCPVVHRFGPGVYIREVFLPAGAIALGHRQKTEHVNIFLKGRVVMFNEDGTKTEMNAPMFFIGKPGRKAGYVIEDVVWLNVYATEETDIETLEATYLDKSQEWLTGNDARLRGEESRLEDIEDFNQVLREFRFSAKVVREQSENESDQIPMPFGSYKIAVSDSKIEGRGIFATSKINTGEIIGPGRVDGKRTPIGRFTNHAKNPNAKMKMFGEDIFLVAISDIDGCEGGFLGDEITTDYRSNLTIMGVKPCQG